MSALLPRESTCSLISEGGTQNVGNLMSIKAKYEASYTHDMVQLLPLSENKCISMSAILPGRALRCQLPAKVLDLFSISVLGALWQSHLRLRGSVSIFGDSLIPSTAARWQLDVLRNTSSYAGRY